MALIEKTDILTVGYDLIDNDHDEFISLLNQLDSAGNADFPALFQQLYEHTEQHFDRENQLMKQFAFPGETEHKGEHQRVLGEFKQFKTRVDKGNDCIWPFVCQGTPPAMVRPACDDHGQRAGGAY